MQYSNGSQTFDLPASWFYCDLRRYFYCNMSLYMNRSFDFSGNADKLATQKCVTYTSKLAELEAAVEKRQSNIRFYTPSAPIIGLNSGDLLDHPAEQYQTTQDVVEDEMVSEVEQEDEMNEFLEDQSESEYRDVMDELEDSTEG